MDIFCDIYFVLIENKEEHLDRRLLNLLQTGQADVAFATPLLEAEEKRGCATTASVCRQIAQELEFMAD